MTSCYDFLILKKISLISIYCNIEDIFVIIMMSMNQ